MNEVLERAGDYPELRRALTGIQAFISVIRESRERMDGPLDELYDFLLRRSGYAAMLEAKGDQESITRYENIMELKTNITNFMRERGGAGTLADFLDEMALYSDVDELNSDNKVSLMTMHSAKGLEFPNVYIAGAEDGIFPGLRSIGDDGEMEEERRLCYVAITRAREKLTITNARQRMVFGRTQNNLLSRFIASVPEELLEKLPKERHSPSVWNYDSEPDFVPRSRGGEAPRRSNAWSGEYPRRSSPAKPLTRSAPASQAASIQLSVGDTVEHKAFGRGTVLTLRPMGPDCILEIAFEKEGMKKLMLSSAGKFMRKV